MHQQSLHWMSQWEESLRVCVRLWQPIKGKLRLNQLMTIKRKHRCDDMCGILQATCLFEQGVSCVYPQRWASPPSSPSRTRLTSSSLRRSCRRQPRYARGRPTDGHSHGSSDCRMWVDNVDSVDSVDISITACVCYEAKSIINTTPQYSLHLVVVVSMWSCVYF